MRFGIPEQTVTMILESIADINKIKKAAVFGSRAIGNYKNGSDIDLVIYGSGITNDVVNKLSILLNEELPLPYYFDIVHYESISTPALKEHIDEYAEIIYCK